MSGRIRTIKPELLEDAVTAGLSDMAFRIFVATILLADDYGRLRFEPRWLRGQVYWSRSINDEAFRAALAELTPLILAYEVKGQAYAAIRNWEKHQKVSHRGKPRIPAPPETLPPPSGGSRETFVPDLRPATSDQGPPTITSSERDGPTVSVGTASAMEVRARFQDAVAEATGNRFALARAPFHDQNLAEIVNTHGPPGGFQQKLAWLTDTVAAWVKATEPKFSGGWAPAKFLDWLNADKPDRHSSRQPIARGAEITKQPYDPEAPWMKLGDTG